MTKKIVFVYKILDENNNDITSEKADNETTTHLGMDDVTDSQIALG